MKAPLGELLMIEIPRAFWNQDLERLLHRFRPAAVFFRRIDSAWSAAEAAEKSARALGQVPLLAVEEQGRGGLSQAFGSLPDALNLSARDAEKAGHLIGSAVRQSGLSLDLAPVFDLSGRQGKASMDSPRAGEPSSEAVAARAAERAGAFVRGLDRHRVLACGRPFPSSAAPAPDDASDPAARPVVSKTMMALWREDLAPFRNLGTSLAMVEVSSAVCKAYDYEFPRPASLSPNVVEGLLRLKLGFEGAALADVRAAALVARLDPGEAAIRALSAGCDLLLIPGPDRQIETVLNRLGRALELGQLAPERVEQALGRVRTVRKLVPPPGPAPSQRDVEELSSGFAEFGRKFAVEERGVA